MSESHRVVVVGHGMVAARLIEELDRHDPGRFDLTVIGDEPHEPYNRLLLSDVLAGRTEIASLTLPDPPEGVRVVRGRCVTRLDRARHEVHLESGPPIAYDTLVLATGARAVMPPLPGIALPDSTTPGVRALRTIDDCRELSAMARRGGHVTVLGGGLLGIEVACGLRRQGVEVSVVHRGARLIDRQLDVDGARVLEATLGDLGVDVVVGAGVDEVLRSPDGALTRVRLSDGREIWTDQLVVTAGVRARDDLAVDSGLPCDAGVLVGDDLRSPADPHVAAIGDCARTPDGCPGLLAPGYRHAEHLARDLADADSTAGSQDDEQFSVVRLKAAGVEAVVLGDGVPDDDFDPSAPRVTSLLDPHGRRSVRVATVGDRIVGAVCVGAARVAAGLTQAYQQPGELPLDPARLLLPASAGATVPRTSTPTTLPDDATVCRCNGVTKRDLVEAYGAGDRTVDQAAARTRCGTGCGGCRSAVEGILDWMAQADPDDEDASSCCTPETFDAADGNTTSVPSASEKQKEATMIPQSREEQHVVVIGGGMVTHRFVEALRARDEAGAHRVTVLAEEPRPPYDRVALTSYFSGRDPEELALGGEDLWADPLVTLRTGVAATAIDRAARTITLSTGQVVAYDHLVLATGSSAAVPPIKGTDLRGTFVYRTIDDVAELRGYVEQMRADHDRPVRGAVIGGGLLGLEAAGALQALGAETTVVEFAPRLMPLQVDDGGGAELRRLIEGLGVTVRTGCASKAVVGREGRARRLKMADGDSLDTDVVVFATGVRPRDELARAADLPIGERGGVIVDEHCATTDPAISAIGEVACIDGRTWGLVAPGYAMAEIAVDRLLGGDSSFPGADSATKLKLLGVDVASFGDAFAETADSLEVVYADSVAGIYKKLVLSGDGRTLLGGVLVGDASGYAGLRPLVGRRLDGDPSAYIAPDSAGGQAGSADLPDEAVICSCNNVAAGGIRCAVRDGCDLAGVKGCTKAGTSCGSCLPVVKKLVEAEQEKAGITVDRRLCEHFAMSRAELFNAVRVSGMGTFTEIIERHGRGRGCDICKPVIASILASLDHGHILAGEQATLQDTNDHVLANLQKDGTYSVVPRMPGGEVTPEGLIVIGEIARDFGLYTKLTGGQRVDMFGARIDQLPDIWRRLVDAGFESGHAYGKSLRTVKSCVGSTWCRYGVQDSVGMAIHLELRYRGLRSPHKLKVGVSGCARECAEARSKDVGVIATENGWNLYVAGNGGATPRHAQLLAQDLDDEGLVRAIDRFFMYYIRTADRLQRTAPWLEELEGGLDHVRSVILDDSLGIADDLDAAMAKHVDAYEDEWAAVLADPEKLRRFSSFVNAPTAADASLAYVVERGQRRPATSAERDAAARGELDVVDSDRRPVLVAGPTLEVRS